MTKVLKHGPDNRSRHGGKKYSNPPCTPEKSSKPFHASPPDLRQPLADEFAQIRMVSGLWTSHPIRSSCNPLHPLWPPKCNIDNRGTQVRVARQISLWQIVAIYDRNRNLKQLQQTTARWFPCTVESVQSTLASRSLKLPAKRLTIPLPRRRAPIVSNMYHRREGIGQ